MDDGLKKINRIFYSDSYQSSVNDEWYVEAIQEINTKFLLEIPINCDSVKRLVEEVFNNDNVELLELLICGSLGFGWDEGICESDFESADWVEDNEDRQYYDENYGEQGTDYFSFRTKNKTVIFSHMRHFDLPHELYEVIDK